MLVRCPLSRVHGDVNSVLGDAEVGSARRHVRNFRHSVRVVPKYDPPPAPIWYVGELSVDPSSSYICVSMSVCPVPDPYRSRKESRMKLKIGTLEARNPFTGRKYGRKSKSFSFAVKPTAGGAT